MKTIHALALSLVVATALSAAEEFKVPERTPVQRFNRLLTLDTGGCAVAIAYAKSQGGSAESYGKFCGEIYVPTWNKQAGFAGFARGTMANFEIFRRDEDAPVEILAQSESMLRFKTPMAYKRSFKDGKLFGTTLEEFTRWLEVTYQVIAASLDCTYQQETTTDNFVIVTVAKK